MHKNVRLSVSLALLISCLQQSPVWGFGSGAPNKACESMIPGHKGLSPQDSGTNPYTVTASSTTYAPGGTVTVTVSGGDFSGVLLQARRPGQTAPVGTFTNPPPDTKLKKCGNEADSVTHSSTKKKPDGTAFTWNAPDSGAGNIEFVATLAVNHNKYWINTKTDELGEAP